MCRRGKPLAVIFAVSIIALASKLAAFGQFGGGGRGEDQVAEARLGEEPKSLIAFTVWVLTLADEQEPTLDEQSTNIAERAANLPPVIGSIDEARELIGRMRVAGIVQKMREIRIVALDGSRASAQIGANMPRVVATTHTEDRRVNNVQIEPTGTVVRVEPTIDAEGNIQLDFTYEASLIEKSTDVVLSESENESTV